MNKLLVKLTARTATTLVRNVTGVIAESGGRAASPEEGQRLQRSVVDRVTSSRSPDYKKDIPHVQGILDSAGAYRGVKHTAGNSKKRQNKKQDSVAIGQKKESFIGKECVKLVGKYEELLEHIKETYKTVSDGDERKAHKVWGLWRQLWARLLEPVDPNRKKGTTSPPPVALRMARARKVKKLAEEFVQAFVHADGLTTAPGLRNPRNDEWNL
eukprot:jgi/Tetstr1/447020/TSEL_034478.t1